MAPVAARRPWLPPGPGPGRAPGRALIRTTPDTGIAVLPGAACAGHPAADKFFSDSPADRRAALAICATCPVRTREKCLETANARGERVGVWGGVDFDAAGRRAARSPHTGKLPRGVQALKTAAQLGELRTEHGTLRAIAAASGLSPETARFYLDLLDLTPGSQELVRSGKVTPSDAVAAIRSGRRGRERAS
jgi:hypothetical protein